MSSRSPCSGRPATSRAPSPRSGPTPPVPLDPLLGPQRLGAHAVEYALLPHRGDWRAAGLYDVADEVLVPLERVRGGGWTGAARPPTGRQLRVEGAPVSAVTREPGGLLVRCFNPSDATADVSVELAGDPARGWLVDLRGRAEAPFEGRCAIRPWGIASLRIEAGPPA